jgi:hypothetical protein
MTFSVNVRNQDGKKGTLTKEQFELVEPIVVKMMNGGLKVKVAEKQIIETLAAAGKPVQFEA